MQPSTSLPFELIDMIIDLAYNETDYQTLRACMLVSSLWRAASRRSVYRKITLRSEAHLAEFEELLARDPTVSPLVRTLVLRGPLSGGDATNNAWVSRLPAVLPRHLRNLDALQFVGLYGLHGLHGRESRHDATALAGFAAFKTVRSLVMRSCTLDTSLLAILAAPLPALRELSVEHIQIPRCAAVLTPAAVASGSRGPLLAALSINVGHIFSPAMQDILAWATSTPSRVSLRAATLTVRISDADAVSRFLNDVGPSLETLELRLENYFGLPLETTSASSAAFSAPTLCSPSPPADIKNQISIERCTSLRALTLADPNLTSRAVLGMIAEIRSPRIRSLSLWLPSGALPDLAALADVLRGEQLRHLVELCFIYHGLKRKDDVLEKLRSQFSGSGVPSSILRIVRRY
jgi:hypothetical protein